MSMLLNTEHLDFLVVNPYSMKISKSRQRSTEYPILTPNSGGHRAASISLLYCRVISSGTQKTPADSSRADRWQLHQSQSTDTHAKILACRGHPGVPGRVPCSFTKVFSKRQCVGMSKKIKTGHVAEMRK